MNNLRVLIVDDEPLIRSGIRNDLNGFHMTQVVAECDSVQEAVRTILSTPCDVVLLDVQMRDGTGFDVIRNVGTRNMPAVIFVTAYDKYAIQAFDVNAVDYLLKPFDDIRLKQSIERARERLSSRPADLVRQLETLLDARGERWAQRLVVRSGERFDFVPVESIDWIESANNYAMLHCRSRDFLSGESLTALERSLDPGRFIRVHRSHIVNLNRIAGVYGMPGGVYELELFSGVRVGTGRQYGDRVRKLLKAGSST